MSSSGIPSRYTACLLTLGHHGLGGRADVRRPRKLNVAAPPSRLQPAACNRRLDFGLFLENLPSPIHAGLEVDVMRAAQLSGILVFDVGRLLEGVGGPAHAAPGRRRF